MNQTALLVQTGWFNVMKVNLSLKLTTISLVILISLSMLGNFTVTNTEAVDVGYELWQEISFNNEHPDLEKKTARRALSHLVDRESVMNIWLEYYQLAEGEAIFPGGTTWTSAKPWYNDKLQRDGDIKEGLKLLKEAGYELDDEEETLKLTLLVPNSNPARVDWCEMIVETWNSYGLSIDLVQMGWYDTSDPYGGIIPRIFDHPALWDNDPATKIPSFEEGGYDMLAVGISVGISDPPIDPIIEGWWEEQYTTGHVDNFYQYSSKKFDAVVDEWIQNGGGTQALAYTIQKILRNDPPAIILFDYINFYY